MATFQHKVIMIVNITRNIGNNIWVQCNIPSVLQLQEVPLHVHLGDNLTCFHRNALKCEWEFSLLPIYHSWCRRRSEERREQISTENSLFSWRFICRKYFQCISIKVMYVFISTRDSTRSLGYSVRYIISGKTGDIITFSQFEDGNSVEK